MKHLIKFNAVNEYKYHGEYWKVRLDENTHLYLNKIGLEYGEIYNNIIELSNNPEHQNTAIYVFYDKDFLDSDFIKNGWGYTFFLSIVKGNFKQYNGLVKLNKMDFLQNKYNI